MTNNNSHIGLGTAAIGRPQYINLRQEAVDDFSLAEFRKHGKLILNEAYRNGIRYFDTAPGYGLAEQLLIDWIQEVEDGYNPLRKLLQLSRKYYQRYLH
jgi:aryl-alcohol dehydrogenase-like predicted oxidoreductase